jgi:6-phosphogluconate dehydrogenase
MASALDVRYLSARKDERIQASKVLKGPNEVPIVHKLQILNDCKDALYCAKVCSYAQGLCIIKAASDQVISASFVGASGSLAALLHYCSTQHFFMLQMGWGVDLSECSRIWKGGCIIRAGFLSRLQAAYVNDPNLCNLLMDPMFVEAVNNRFRLSSYRSKRCVIIACVGLQTKCVETNRVLMCCQRFGLSSAVCFPGIL